MRIYFTRHGESEANVLHIISNRDLDHGLITQGQQQAENLAKYLHQFPITHIITSPVRRAVQTSTIIANHLKLDYVMIAALRDFDCGVLEGRSDEAAWQQWTRLKDAWVIEKRYDEKIEGGESYDDMRRRFLPFLQDLIQLYGHTREEIVCVSHGGIYSMMMPLILTNVDAAAITSYGIDYASCLVAELRSGGLTCIAWNGQPYPPEQTTS